MAPDPPPEYGPGFLTWLRETTEAAWANVEEPSLDDFRSAGFIGATWRRGTRWTGPLDDETITQLERRFGVHFPPDYRLLLQTLHSTTPWRRGAHDGTVDLVEYRAPGFYDWLHEGTCIRARMQAVADRSEFAEELDLHYGGRRWLEGGPSPQLLPIYAHRYVVDDDSQWVLSIVGGDAIVYGENLRAYLLAELDDVLKASEDRP
ncbi:hypothetical protein [Nocardioides sp.]|jgi:hypothetical protein|uniref:hypothetical protein n=1 Tax=Nocardioides sp. TaxID=35761 RepID=UPI002F40A369